MNSRQLPATLLVFGLVLALFASACSTSTDSQLEASDAPEPAPTLEAPPELESAPFEVTPEVAPPGGTVEINYTEPTSRGGYYFLHQWTDSGWSEPTHLIETDSNGSPRIFSADVDDFEIETYEAGPSPENAPLPDVPDGFWMLCETNSPDTACVIIEIAEP